MYEKLVIDNLENEVINSTLLGTIDTVLSMIREEAPNPYYKLVSSMITLQEELAYNMLFDDSIYDNLDISMQKNNLRFIYLPDKDISFICTNFSIHSYVSETDKMFCTYFIGKHVKNEASFARKLVCTIIFNYINSIILDKYNTDINKLINYCYRYNYYEPDFIGALLGLIDIYICYFKAVDEILDLKFDDWEEISKTINYCRFYDHTMLIAESCYKYAITEDHDPGDFKILCNECVNIYKRTIGVG